jgi:hypothetical protein
MKTNPEFDAALRQVLSVSKEELVRREKPGAPGSRPFFGR